MRIVMFITSNAHNGQAVDRCKMKLVELRSREFVKLMDEEVIARSQSTLWHLFPLDNREECLPVVLSGENFQAVLVDIVPIKQVLVVDTLSEPWLFLAIREIPDGREQYLSRRQSLLTIDQKEFPHALRHRFCGSRHYRSEEMRPTVFMSRLLNKVRPQGIPLLF
jgi:hypothetical protein